MYDINYVIYKHDHSVNFNKNQKTRTLNLSQKKYFLYPRIIFKLMTTKEFYQLLYKKLQKNKKNNAI